MREVVIVDAVRSPIGKRNGGLVHKHSNELLGDVLVGLLERSGLSGSEVDHVVGGCVLQLGMQAANVARNAWLTAGLPMEVPAATVNAQVRLVAGSPSCRAVHDRGRFRRCCDRLRCRSHEPDPSR
ncbi:thiolase family protein [Actinomadura verrucosospora]|uniref:thiolase family protein n=1 Tax=Actinomadura verrucosospora TaxID=46165 RepID=UPI003CD09BAB